MCVPRVRSFAHCRAEDQGSRASGRASEREDQQVIRWKLLTKPDRLRNLRCGRQRREKQSFPAPGLADSFGSST